MTEDWYSQYRRQTEAMVFTRALGEKNCRYFRNGTYHIVYYDSGRLGSEAWKYGTHYSESSVRAAIDYGYAEEVPPTHEFGLPHIRLTKAGRAAIDGPTMGEHG